jgi:calcium-dependent protein kinase
LDVNITVKTIFKGEIWLHVSEEAKHLIRGMLEYDPFKRMAAKDVLEHEWFLK